jgi:hypothetical protein
MSSSESPPSAADCWTSSSCSSPTWRRTRRTPRPRQEMTAIDKITVPSFERGKPVRRPLLEHLSRERIVYPVLPCPCCGDSWLREIGQDVTETLELVLRRWKVIRHVREKLVCRAGEAITQPPAPCIRLRAACRAQGWAPPRTPDAARPCNPRPSLRAERIHADHRRRGVSRQARCGIPAAPVHAGGPIHCRQPDRRRAGWKPILRKSRLHAPQAPAGESPVTGGPGALRIAGAANPSVQRKMHDMDSRLHR